MRKHLLFLAAMMVLVRVSVAQTPRAQAQADGQAIEACINELRECGPFADSTTTRPPAVCCEPLENVIENNVDCLCLIFGNEEVIQFLEINVTNAITLPQRCGLEPFDLSSNCQGPIAPSTASALSPTKAPVSIAPSEGPSVSTTANAPVSGEDTSGANSFAWAGSAIMGPFLFYAAFMFY